jgi:hypothetical protein
MEQQREITFFWAFGVGWGLGRSACSLFVESKLHSRG